MLCEMCYHISNGKERSWETPCLPRAGTEEQEETHSRTRAQKLPWELFL